MIREGYQQFRNHATRRAPLVRKWLVLLGAVALMLAIHSAARAGAAVCAPAT